MAARPKEPVLSGMPAVNAGLRNRVRGWLEASDRQGLRRTLEEPSGIDLCSNNYLGFAQHPRIRHRFAEASRTLGVGSTGSRLLRGHRSAFTAIERRFARIKCVPAALFFGSGWAANLAVLTSFPREGDIVFSDELNHASLIDGIRLSRARKVVFPHCDTTALARLLASEPCAGQRFVVTESLFSMDGDLAPLAEYAALRSRYDLALIVDEAHAVGVYGEAGSGLIEECGCQDDIFLSVNSAGKALGVSGSFACGPEWAIDYLVQAARPFVFSTAPPPAIAESIDEALTVLAEEPTVRQRVRQLGSSVRRSLGLPQGDSPIVPVILGTNEKATLVARRLQKSGFDVRAIRPPTVPDGTARLRVSLHADLTDQEIEDFVRCLRKVLEEVKQ